jgi:hypothetical protein
MKNITNIKRKTGKMIVCFFASFLGIPGFLSCSDYLDIVPDNTITLEDYFSNREKAYQALAKVYSLLPEFPNHNLSPFMFGDDYLEGQAWEETSAGIQPIQVMKGQMNEQSPPMNRWAAIYVGIRAANTFLENIDNALDMTAAEKNEWKAQVTFIKAFFNFELLQYWGPYVIIDKNIPMDAEREELFLRRSKIEDCFDYMIRLIDEAIPNLKDRAGENEFGQVDKMAALAVKARIMLFRASPFYNGNSQMYSDFYDYDGRLFFPQEEKAEKWEDALKAVDEAIAFCERQGKGLYTFDGMPFSFDVDDYAVNPLLKTYYDLRMLIVDQWNKELIWGRVWPREHESTIQSMTGILQLEGGSVISSESSYAFAQNWLGASFQMMERYYTKNGLPVREDKTFDASTMYDIVRTPDTAAYAPGGPDVAGYTPLRGILQPGVQTIKMYLDRELRFYANLGISGGYWRQHSDRLNTMMYGGTPGGWYSSRSGTNWFWSGIGIQKFIHPESKSGQWTRQVNPHCSTTYQEC